MSYATVLLVARLVVGIRKVETNYPPSLSLVKGRIRQTHHYMNQPWLATLTYNIMPGVMAYMRRYGHEARQILSF